MVYNKFKKTTLLSMILTLFLVVSCTESETEMLQRTLSNEEIQMSVKAENLSADVNNIIEQDDIIERFAAKGESSTSGICATREVEKTDSGRTVMLDFGDGCTGDNGKEYSGKIKIVYTRTRAGYSKEITFDSFTINGNVFTGGKSIKWVKENGNKNPESTITKDVTITLTGGEVLTRKGTRIREKTAGILTKRRGDDVYAISGSWESVNRNGVVRTALVKTNLTRKYVCKYVVSGVIEVSKDGVKATIDFGDGSCDNKAMVTDANGDTKEISLGR